MKMNNRLDNKHHNIILDFSRDDVEKCKVYSLLSDSPPCPSPRNRMHSIGYYINSCNGLLYFEGDRVDEFYIFNPTTNESKLIPLPPSKDLVPPGLRSYSGCTGLGFDSRSNDYKIIIYVNYVTDDDPPGYCCHDEDREAMYVELYSLKTDSWKRLSDFPTLSFAYPCVYADGCFYWVSPLLPYNSIVSFDFSDETFSSLSLEDISPSLEDAAYCTTIVECGGCLGLVAFKFNSPCFEIWVKTGSSSWDKRWDFSLPQLDHHPYSASDLLILGVSGEVLYLASPNDVVFAYDCAANHLEKLQIHLRRHKQAQFISYVETTASLSLLR